MSLFKRRGVSSAPTPVVLPQVVEQARETVRNKESTRAFLSIMEQHREGIEDLYYRNGFGEGFKEAYRPVIMAELRERLI